MLAAEKSRLRACNRGRIYGVDSVYTARRWALPAPPLRDSYHIGQTFSNDYGRPYAGGFNNITGFSVHQRVGPLLDLRARRVSALRRPSRDTPTALANQLSSVNDGIGPLVRTQRALRRRIPYGKYTLAQNPFRLQEANLAVPCRRPRNQRLVNQTPGLAPAYGGFHGVEQQRGRHLLFPGQPRRASVHPLPFSKLFGAHALRLFLSAA